MCAVRCTHRHLDKRVFMEISVPSAVLRAWPTVTRLGLCTAWDPKDRADVMRWANDCIDDVDNDGCGNFDIILGHFASISRPHATPHAPCNMRRFSARSRRMLSGACNPMVCPIHGYRPYDMFHPVKRAHGTDWSVWDQLFDRFSAPKNATPSLSISL